MVRWAWWWAALLACGDDKDAATPDAGFVRCVEPSSTYRGIARAFDPAIPFDQLPRVAGARVCFGNRPDLPCAMSDAEGRYELRCVTPGDVVLTFAHPDYVTSAWLRVARGVDEEQDVTLLTAAQNAAFYTPVGTTFPRAGYGVIAANDVTHVDGITFAAAGAQGPYYSRDGLTIDTAATGTVGDGLAFFIAPVGSLSITIEPVDPAQSCGQAGGGFISTGRGLTVPVLEGTEVGVLTACR